MKEVETSDAPPLPDKSPINHGNDKDECDLQQDFNASVLEDIHEEDHEDHEDLMSPLYITSSGENEMRSRRGNSMGKHNQDTDDRPIKRFYHNKKEKMRECFHKAVEIQATLLRSTIGFMNLMAKVLFWASLLAMCIGVIWYSRELAIHGTDPHLIAWFSAGAFVILGFPISIYGILMHLTNYYQPNIQCYVVRILWMVPIYSIESWLCLRFHEFAIYIETLRDCYESFCLYCFLQYLIEVLGGEESLVSLLKNKSPTRGVHFGGVNFFVKPWLMGQPISIVDPETGERTVKWSSPFFKNCKFGVLQYVLIKAVSALFVVILEKFGYYKEGDFTPKGGYLYICILTNCSQCWALYCLIFFYYATKNELAPIRPIGKFLAVKCLVFFTWYQGVGISILYQMNLIPEYAEGGWTADDVAKGIQAYLICIEMFGAAIVHIFVFPHTDYIRPLTLNQQQQPIRNFGRRMGRRGKRHYGDDRSVCSKTSDIQSYFDLENPSQLETEIDHNEVSRNVAGEQKKHERTGFVNAFLDSAVPRDVIDSTAGIARGDFKSTKSTLLYHASASDHYSLFSNRRKAMEGKVHDAVESKKI